MAKTTKPKQGKAEAGKQKGPIPRSPEEKKVWAVLQRAQQDVKPIIKLEMEGELVSEEILNLRIRG